MHTHIHTAQVSDVEIITEDGVEVFLVEEKKSMCKQKQAILCMPNIVKEVLRFYVKHIRPFLSRGGAHVTQNNKKGHTPPPPQIPLFVMIITSPLFVVLRSRPHRRPACGFAFCPE